MPVVGCNQFVDFRWQNKSLRYEVEVLQSSRILHLLYIFIQAVLSRQFVRSIKKIGRFLFSSAYYNERWHGILGEWTRLLFVARFSELRASYTRDENIN